jgi:hypothetical protein
MRSRSNQPSAQSVRPLEPSGDNIEQISPTDILGHDGVIKGAAVSEEELSDPGPPVERWEVVKGGNVQTTLNGQRARLVVGKVIDSLNYDIALVRRQGVELRAVDA